MLAWLVSPAPLEESILNIESRQIHEQLAHTVAQRAAMPSQNDQVSNLRAQLAYQEAQLAKRQVQWRRRKSRKAELASTLQ